MKEVILTGLRQKYLEFMGFKKSVREQVRIDYEAKIQDEVRRRISEAEVAFAEELVAAKDEYGLTVTEIQDEVFHSRTWSRWKTWRDLMGIGGERENQKARVVLDKPYRLEEGEWYAIRNEEGDIDPILLDILETKDGFAVWPPMDEQDHGYASYVQNFGRNQKRFNDFIVTAFKKYGDDPLEKEA